MLELQNGSGAQTLDIKQPEWQRQGYGVVGDVGTPGSGPCAVTANGSGTLGAGGGALSVAAGNALVGGTVVSVSSTTVDISTGSSSPRKDLLWVDQNGDLTVTEGTPTPHKPDGFSGFETYYPAVPFPSTTPAACLAAIWVPANASNLTDTTTNVQDRRMAADHVANEMVSQAVSTERVNNRPAWQEVATIDDSDTGSPVSIDVDTSSYDIYRVSVRRFGQEFGGFRYLDMTFNNVTTSDYFYRHEGSQSGTTGQNGGKIQLAQSGTGNRYAFGDWYIEDDGEDIRFYGNAGVGVGNVAVRGYGDVLAPLDSIQLSTGTDNCTVFVVIKGRNRQ